MTRPALMLAAGGLLARRAARSRRRRGGRVVPGTGDFAAAGSDPARGRRRGGDDGRQQRGDPAGGRLPPAAGGQPVLAAWCVPGSRPPSFSTATARWCATSPYNGDPDRSSRCPGGAALDRLRARVCPAVISNQSGVGRGTIGIDDGHAVNARVEELLGPFGPWRVCPHDRRGRLPCRKPSPGIVRLAAAAARCRRPGDAS